MTSLQVRFYKLRRIYAFPLLCIHILALFLTISIPARMFGNPDSCPWQEYKQWFMGPIVTPNATTVLPGHPGVEFDIIASRTYGSYDGHWKINHTSTIWSVRPLLDFQLGFNDFIGIEFIGSAVTNFSQGKSSTNLEDTILRFGYQVSLDRDDSWIPDFRILFQENFPTGNYQNLNPRKNKTDLSGQGSYQSGIQLVLQKLFRSNQQHPFRLRGSVGYFVPSPVSVKGLNYYGGSSETLGRIYPGQYLSTFFFGEYALSRRWNLACELNYQQGKSGRYRRKKGENIMVPSSTQISILPEIQHTYSKNLGIIVGGWFTLTGKNSAAFSQAFGSVLILF